MAPIPESDESHDRQPPEENNHEIEDVETPNFVISVESENSESDEDDNVENQGYQLLPQGEIDIDESEEDGEHDDEGESNVHGSVALSVEDSAIGGTSVEGLPSSKVEEENSDTQVNPGLIHQLRCQNFPYCHSKNVPSYMQVPEFPRPEKHDLLWNQERCGQSANMNEDHIEKIKSAMSTFQLPVTQIPDWAKNVSEEEWRKKLLSKLPQDSIPQSQQAVKASSSSQTHFSSNEKDQDKV